MDRRMKMAKKDRSEGTESAEEFFMEDIFLSLPNIKDPRISKVISMFLCGKKKGEIAEHFGVHRKTVGRWIRKVKEGLEIDVESDDYRKVFMSVLAEHGEMLILQRVFAVDALTNGKHQIAYTYQRQAERSLRRRDKALETFGIQYKSRLEKENESLKNICAWALIRTKRIEDNLLALENCEEKPWSEPHNVSVNEINKVKECPEMFHFDRYFSGVRQGEKDRYVDRYDIELAVAKLCHSDISFNSTTDDPVAFVIKKIFKDSLPLEDENGI
jgi:transposase